MDRQQSSIRGNCTYSSRLNDFFQRQVHPRIALDQVAIERVAALELNQHRMALSCVEQTEG